MISMYTEYIQTPLQDLEILHKFIAPVDLLSKYFFYPRGAIYKTGQAGKGFVKRQIRSNNLLGIF